MNTRSYLLVVTAALMGLVLFVAALAAPDVIAQDGELAPQGIVPLAGDFFVHVAVTNTISAAVTYIDHPRLNADPNAIFLATQNWNPQGAAAGVANPHEIGAFYAAGEAKWAIFNEDRAAMTPNAAFNVFIPLSGSLSFVHESEAGNTANNWTNIEHPAAGEQDAIVLAMHSYNPGGVGGEYHDHHLGVWYSFSEQWAIFNQNSVDMEAGRDFNVYIVPPLQIAITHTATNTNNTGLATFMDHPLLNGNPDAKAIVTQNWSLSGPVGVYNDQPIGVRYDTVLGLWAIFNESGAPMPDGAGFNVLISPGRNYLPLFIWE